MSHDVVCRADLPGETVAPLARGLSVLRVLADADGTLKVSELTRTVGLARSSVDRVLSTLAQLGYLRLDETSAVLLPAVAELGNAYLSSAGLHTLLAHEVQTLAETVDAPVSLAVADGEDARLVLQAVPDRSVTVGHRVGHLLPAGHSTVAALADRTVPGTLEPARRTFTDQAPAPWPGDRGDTFSGLVNIAMPVRGPAGAVACAVTVTAHPGRRGDQELVESVSPRLRQAVGAMERKLGRPSPRVSFEAATAVADGLRVSKARHGRDFVESLARGLMVLTAFDLTGCGPTAGALAGATGLARATVRRALNTLEHLGYARSDDRKYLLTPQVLSLGFVPASSTSVAEIAQPHLTRLAMTLSDSASMAVLSGDEIRYTARAAAQQIMSVDITIGTRLPAHATSMGRVMLAALPPDERAVWLARAVLNPITRETTTVPADFAALLDRAREDGFSLTDGELDGELRSVAVPVRGADGRTVAAVNVAMHRGRRSVRDCLTDVLPELRSAAGIIEREIQTVARFFKLPLV